MIAAFWIECKGPRTPVQPHQWRWWYGSMAAGVPVFCVRHPNDLNALFEDIGFQTPLSAGERRIQADGTYTREADVQRDVKALLQMYGFNVSDLSQGYRPGGRRHATTRQTPGIPDMWVTRPTDQRPDDLAALVHAENVRFREAVRAVERGAVAGHRRADGRPAEYRIPAQDFWGLCVLIGVKLDPEAEAEGRVFLQRAAAEQGE